MILLTIVEMRSYEKKIEVVEIILEAVCRYEECSILEMRSRKGGCKGKDHRSDGKKSSTM